jgi:Rrf2 family protein
VQVSARVDYGVRAMLVLADRGEPATCEALAKAQDLPAKFLGAILGDLRRGGLLRGVRGPDGGFQLARPASEITIADVMRTLEGPLAEVRGEPPETTAYEGAAEHLQDVWIAVRASLRNVLERITLQDVIRGQLPGSVAKMTADPGAWNVRSRRFG